MLNLPRNGFPAHIDDFLSELTRSLDQPLAVPSELDNGGVFGGAPLSVQAIASWYRSSTSKHLHLAEELALSGPAQDRFARSLMGMCAMYFADEVIFGANKASRFGALKAVAPFVQAMNASNFQGAQQSKELALVCFAGARSEFLNPLYAKPQPGAVRSAVDFRTLLGRILASVDKSLPSQFSTGQLDLLSSLVHQLFQNTDEHGAYDVSGSRFLTSVRGLVVRLTSLSNVHQLMTDVGPDTALRTYMSKAVLLPQQEQMRSIAEDLQAQEGSDRPMRMLELSVFDTGPGMALRWLSKSGAQKYSDIGEQEERDALEACFQKHATTKAVNASGIGLPMALMAMKRLNAFMSLRTGRMSLYQDFSSSRTEGFEPKPRYGKNFATTEIAGTGYTICFRVS